VALRRGARWRWETFAFAWSSTAFGYVADHWCRRGHVLLVLEGELVTELEDGREFILEGRVELPGRERSRSAPVARSARSELFIVD